MEEKVYMFIKFGEEDKLKQFQQGILYSKNLQYYRDKYLETGDNSMGDPYEGRYVGRINNKNIELIIDETNKIPVFCMYALKKSDVYNEKKDESILKPSEKFKEIVKNNYWQSALIITSQAKFLNKLIEIYYRDGIDIEAKLVQYMDFNENSQERLKKYISNPNQIALWKDKKYVEQREYRIVFPKKRVEDHFIVNIGDISDISIIYNKEDLKRFMDDEYTIKENLKEF